MGSCCAQNKLISKKESQFEQSHHQETDIITLPVISITKVRRFSLYHPQDVPHLQEIQYSSIISRRSRAKSLGHHIQK